MAIYCRSVLTKPGQDCLQAPWKERALHIWCSISGALQTLEGGWHDLHQLVTSTAMSDSWCIKGLRHKEIIKCQEKLLRFPSGETGEMGWDQRPGFRGKSWAWFSADTVIGTLSYPKISVFGTVKGSHQVQRWNMQPEQLQHQGSKCRRRSHLCYGRDWSQVCGWDDL